MSSNIKQKSYEVYAQHASDLVHWVEGSGPVLDESRPLSRDVNKSLDISLIDAPKKIPLDAVSLDERTPVDLKLTHKPGVMILWRFNAADNLTMSQFKGKDDADENVQRPIENAYKVNGTLEDKPRWINPREFNLEDVGNFIDVTNPESKGFQVKIYRSPSGTKMGSLGGLQGQLKWVTGEVASWAIITCKVTLKHTIGTRSFRAQADINGDFRLAFSALPFPKMEGDSRPPYECEISIAALKAVSGEKWHQPDDFTSTELKQVDADEFNESIDLSFIAGTKQRVTSFTSDGFLILKETA